MTHLLSMIQLFYRSYFSWSSTYSLFLHVIRLLFLFFKIPTNIIFLQEYVFSFYSWSPSGFLPAFCAEVSWFCSLVSIFNDFARRSFAKLWLSRHIPGLFSIAFLIFQFLTRKQGCKMLWECVPLIFYKRGDSSTFVPPTLTWQKLFKNESLWVWLFFKFIYSPRYSHALGSKKKKKLTERAIPRLMLLLLLYTIYAMYTVLRWQRNDHAVH